MRFAAGQSEVVRVAFPEWVHTGSSGSESGELKPEIPSVIAQGAGAIAVTAEGESFADLLGDAPEWQEGSLCAQTDPEAFFPEKGGSTREAKRICSRCEVRAECLEYAFSHRERFGIWGGLSERERRKALRSAA